MSRPQPEWIFIICAARSGSRYLRCLLSASPEIAAVPYDVNFVWRRGQESRPDDMLACNVSDAIRRGIVARLTALSEWDRNVDARFILEKSVSNALRVPFLASLFPDARFVHLVRDGRAVVESASRMWSSSPQPSYLFAKLHSLRWSDWRYCVWYLANQLRRLRPDGAQRAVWGPRYPRIEEDLRNRDLVTICCRQWIECVSRASADLAELPAQRVHFVRYEDLMAGSMALAGVCQFIGLARQDAVLAAHRRITIPARAEAWRAGLRPDQRSAIEGQLHPWLRRLGYLGVQ